VDGDAAGWSNALIGGGIEGYESVAAFEDSLKNTSAEGKGLAQRLVTTVHQLFPPIDPKAAALGVENVEEHSQQSWVVIKAILAGQLSEPF